MANPVAAYAYTTDLPRRIGGGPVIDAEPVRPASTRARPAPLRLVYDASFAPLRDAETARGRARSYDGARRDAGYGADADEMLREAGRRKAPATVSFAAQQIAQEGLSPGAYFENYKPALAAYGRAASYATASTRPQVSLFV
jgi:hypothetical protein